VNGYKFRTPLDDGIKPEEIVGWASLTKKSLHFRVKFEGIDEPEFIKTKEMSAAYPQVSQYKKPNEYYGVKY
jgi:hypothetical protein